MEAKMAFDEMRLRQIDKAMSHGIGITSGIVLQLAGWQSRKQEEV
jgi:hypothetical protein